MSRTIEAIERHMRPSVQFGRHATASSSIGERGDTDSSRRERKLVGEWQHGGPETFSGLAVRKLRLALAPAPSVMIAAATC
ncbi:MAG TPA: hypothetical protein VJT50_05645 [Pyrinomonadaceae bacterium]|nr:hypothetical protein [Pyrinomonadaceae bacterium]